MSDVQPPSDLEPERLAAAASPSNVDAERLWKNMEARLAADETLAATPHHATREHSPQMEAPIRRRWWIEVLTGVAAFFLFAMMLGSDASRVSVRHVPGGGDGKAPVVDDEPDPAPLLEKLKSDKQDVRRAAYLALLRGGTKTRAAVNALWIPPDGQQQIYDNNDEFQQVLTINDLHRAYPVIDALSSAADTNSLAFWQALWNAEALEQPDVWHVGLQLHPDDQQPTVPPSPLLADALLAKYGEEKATALTVRFKAAFATLRSFQKWERGGDKALIDALPAQGVALAPVVLYILTTPEAPVVTFPRRAGMEGTYPEDHLRMMVAAVALHLHEAEPLIFRFTSGYLGSPTIQANAIGALWHLGGHTEKGFPLNVYVPTKDEVETVQRWWREQHKNDPKGKFDAEIEILLAQDRASAESAETMGALRALKKGGNEARAALRASIRAAELKWSDHALELADSFSDDTESLDFWTDVWDGEARQDPWIWGYGVEGKGTSFPPLEKRESQPRILSGSPEVLPALRLKFGDERGAQLAKRFCAAFQAYVNFKHWNRGKVGEPNTAEHAQQLQAVADAGIAIAPPVLKLLSQPVANNLESRRDSELLTDIEAGKAPPRPTSLDHLRMIVAVDRLKLHEAEELLMEKIALSYPLSMTIQQHAAAAIYRLHGDTEVIKNFPFDLGNYELGWNCTFYAWWLEEQTRALKADLAGKLDRVNTARATARRIAKNILPGIETNYGYLIQKVEKYNRDRAAAQLDAVKLEAWNKQSKAGEQYAAIAERLKKAIDAFKAFSPSGDQHKGSF